MRRGVQEGGSGGLGALVTERNVDVIVLTPNSTDIDLRMNVANCNLYADFLFDSI